MLLSRRTWLAASAAALAARNAFPAGSVAADPPAGIVDAHTHFYDPTRPEGIPWPAKTDKTLYRPVLPVEFERLGKPLGVTGTIVVEASPWLEDNQWLLELADRHASVLGVVGRLAPGTEAFPAHLARFAKHPRFRGIRLSSAEVKRGLLAPAFLDDCRRLADANLALDVNGGPDMPEDVARLAKKVPALRIVIDHCANVFINGRPPPASWREAMQSAAEHEQVWCKVSALAEATRQTRDELPRKVEFYRPLLDDLWKIFGEKRLIYGSNWPVCSRAADYATVLAIVSEYWTAKGEAARDLFFRLNARAAYQWPAA